MSQYWVLVTIGFCCSFLPLLFLWMIPSRKAIEELQDSMKEEDDVALAKKNDNDDEGV